VTHSGSRLTLSRAFILVPAMLLATFLAVGPGVAQAGKPSKGGGGGGSTGGITFSSPVIVDPVHTYGEPDVKVDTDGTTYTSGPWGTGTQRSIWNRSIDGGRTFRAMHETPISSANESDTFISGPGGGDTDIAIDHTGKVYYSDLAALTDLKVATWDNAARKMTAATLNPVTNGQGANGYDRQWFGLWDPPSRPAGYTGPLPVNYLVYAEALAGCCEAGAYSLDGINYTGPTVEYSIGSDGPPVVDQQTGTLLEAISVTNDQGTADSSDDRDAAAVAILTRDPSQPTNDPALRHADVVMISDLPANTETGALFPVIGIDTARNAYVAWVTRGSNGQTASQQPDAWQIFYSYATAASGWKTWSAPVRLSSSPSNTNIMPWAVAGSAGRLAVVWYGTDDSTHDPSTADVHQQWNVYLAMVSNAASGSPQILQVKATPHTIHYGTICLEGLGCATVQGNRNNADFFYVTTDPRNGAVVIAFNDTSNELAQDDAPVPADGTVDHRGAPVVTLLRQNGGVGLFGTTVTGDPASGTSLKDGSGDALFDPIYGNASVPELDLRGLKVASSGANFDIRLDVSSLDNLAHGPSATGAQAVDYVVRWIGPAVDSSTGIRNPIYYAAVEVTSGGGVPTFFAGKAVSVELCSVSACFPHVTDYPAPPQGGDLVSGEIILQDGKPDAFILHVPKALVGDPAVGSLMESLSAFTFARNKSAGIPITNTEAQAGTLPIEVDGVCCVTAKL
jgi:hypothetical protein